DAIGGTLRAIEIGYIQNEIQNAAYECQREIESGARIVVGVNRFQQEERAAPAFRPDQESERAQIEGLRNVRASRSRPLVEQKLAALQQAARDGTNLMPPILDAADAFATVGEISDRLRAEFGEFRES